MCAPHETDRTSNAAERMSEQGTVFRAETVKHLIHAALSHDAVSDKVHELLVEHVVNGRFHPSVVSASLRPMLDEVLNVATAQD